jgi:phytol kinase
LTVPGPLTSALPSPLAGMALVTLACGALLGGVTWWKRASAPPAELTRKAVHVGMGLIALTLPWLFSARWPVLALCAGLGAAFVALRRFARQSDLGAAMHDVNRASRGDLYFAVSVGALWVLAAGDRLLFVVPVLVLTLGDAVAALVGVRYGRTRFDGSATGKSAEGSVALFVVTFVSVHLPLVLAGRVGAIEGILIAATMAVAITLLEAVAWRGLDNVFVPIGAFLLLHTWLPLGAVELAWRLGLILALLVVVAAMRARTTLRDAALAGAALFGFLAGTLGGWPWVVAPLVLFVAYPRLFPPVPRAGATRLAAVPAFAAEREHAVPSSGLEREHGIPSSRPEREHDMHAVAGVVMPAVAWLFAARLFDRADFLAPYTATFVAQLAMIGAVHASAHTSGGPRARLLAVILKGALVVLPAMALHRPGSQALAAALLALAGAVVAGLAINRGTSRVTAGLDAELQWLRQARWAGAASLVTALALLLR